MNLFGCLSLHDPSKIRSIFLTSKFSILPPSSYPIHKTKTGTANRWETTTNSNPPGQQVFGFALLPASAS
jgi:hypothetical protein